MGVFVETSGTSRISGETIKIEMPEGKFRQQFRIESARLGGVGIIPPAVIIL